MLTKVIINILENPIKRYRYKKKWRSNNPHNFTVAGNSLVNGTVTVGNYTYGIINVPYKSGHLRIGHFCSISDDVSFLTGGEHFKKSFKYISFLCSFYE